MDHRTFENWARVGDVLKVNVNNPHPQTIVMTLCTPEAAAYANTLLSDRTSGWRLERVLVSAGDTSGA